MATEITGTEEDVRTKVAAALAAGASRKDIEKILGRGGDANVFKYLGGPPEFDEYMDQNLIASEDEYSLDASVDNPSGGDRVSEKSIASNSVSESTVPYDDDRPSGSEDIDYNDPVSLEAAFVDPFGPSESEDIDYNDPVSLEAAFVDPFGPSESEEKQKTQRKIVWKNDSLDPADHGPLWTPPDTVNNFKEIPDSDPGAIEEILYGTAGMANGLLKLAGDVWGDLTDNERNWMSVQGQSGKEYWNKLNPDSNDDSFTALMKGFEQTYGLLRNAWNSYTGDNMEVLEQALGDIKRPSTESTNRFVDSLREGLTEDSGALDHAKSLVRSVMDEPQGAAHMMIEQVPNAGVAMGGMGTGAMIGLAVTGGNPIGGLVGGIIGLFAADIALVTGEVAQGKAQDGDFTDKDRDETVKQGAIKGGTIAVVDTVTLGIGKLIFGIPGKAVEKAVTQVVTRNGVDATNKAAVSAAFIKTPALLNEAKRAGQVALDLTMRPTRRVPRGAATFALEGTGEAIGERAGTELAGLEGDWTDALLEGLMAIPFSIGEMKIAKELQSPGKNTRIMDGIDRILGSDGPAGGPPGGPPGGASSNVDNILNAASAEEAIDLADGAINDDFDGPDGPSGGGSVLEGEYADITDNADISVADQIKSDTFDDETEALSLEIEEGITPAEADARVQAAKIQAANLSNEAILNDASSIFDERGAKSENALPAILEGIEGMSSRLQELASTDRADPGAWQSGQLDLIRIEYGDQVADAASGWIGREVENSANRLLDLSAANPDSPAPVDMNTVELPDEHFEMALDLEDIMENMGVDTYTPGAIKDAIDNQAKIQQEEDPSKPLPEILSRLDVVAKELLEIARGRTETITPEQAAQGIPVPPVQVSPANNKPKEYKVGDAVDAWDAKGNPVAATVVGVNADGRPAAFDTKNSKGILLDSDLGFVSVNIKSPQYSLQSEGLADRFENKPLSRLTKKEAESLSGVLKTILATTNPKDRAHINARLDMNALVISNQKKAKEREAPASESNDQIGVDPALQAPAPDEAAFVSFEKSYVSKDGLSPYALDTARIKAIAGELSNEQEAVLEALDAAREEALGTEWTDDIISRGHEILEKSEGSVRPAAYNKVVDELFEMFDEADDRGKADASEAPELQDIEEPRPFDPDRKYQPTAEGSSIVEGSAPKEIELLEIDVETFKKATDTWAAVFENPQEYVITDHRAKTEPVLTLEEAQTRVDEWRDAARSQQRGSLANYEKTIISLFDYSGNWARPYANAGFNVILVDIQDGMDVMDLNEDWIQDNVDGEVFGILAACPCTVFTGSGNKHKNTRVDKQTGKTWIGRHVDGRTEAGKDLVFKTLSLIERLQPRMWVLENPVGQIESMTGLPKPRMSFEPHHFGDPYTKKTMLYGQFNSALPLANVEPEGGIGGGGGSIENKNMRSETPEGFAYAFFMANNQASIGTELEDLEFDFPETSGAVRGAYEAGISAVEIREMLKNTYGNELYEESVAVLAEATAQKHINPDLKFNEEGKPVAGDETTSEELKTDEEILASLREGRVGDAINMDEEAAQEWVQSAADAKILNGIVADQIMAGVTKDGMDFASVVVAIENIETDENGKIDDWEIMQAVLGLRNEARKSKGGQTDEGQPAGNTEVGEAEDGQEGEASFDSTEADGRRKVGRERKKLKTARETDKRLTVTVGEHYSFGYETLLSEANERYAFFRGHDPDYGWASESGLSKEVLQIRRDNATRALAAFFPKTENWEKLQKLPTWAWKASNDGSGSSGGGLLLPLNRNDLVFKAAYQKTDTVMPMLERVMIAAKYPLPDRLVYMGAKEPDVTGGEQKKAKYAPLGEGEEWGKSVKALAQKLESLGDANLAGILRAYTQATNIPHTVAGRDLVVKVAKDRIKVQEDRAKTQERIDKQKKADESGKVVVDDEEGLIFPNEKEKTPEKAPQAEEGEGYKAKKEREDAAELESDRIKYNQNLPVQPRFPRVKAEAWAEKMVPEGWRNQESGYINDAVEAFKAGFIAGVQGQTVFEDHNAILRNMENFKGFNGQGYRDGYRAGLGAIENGDKPPGTKKPETADKGGETADRPNRVDYGKTNKIVNTDQKQAALDRIKARQTRLKSGVDPEDLVDAAIIATFHIEAGTRKFADWARAMVKDLGDWITPSLRSQYESRRYDPDVIAAGHDTDMTDSAEVADLVQQIEAGTLDLTAEDEYAQLGEEEAPGGEIIPSDEGKGELVDEVEDVADPYETLDSPDGQDGWVSIGGTANAGFGLREIGTTDSNGNRTAVRQVRITNEITGDGYISVWESRDNRFTVFDSEIEVSDQIYYYSISDSNIDALDSDVDILDGDAVWDEFGGDIINAFNRHKQAQAETDTKQDAADKLELLAPPQTLGDYLYQKLPEITDNRILKKMFAEFHDENVADVTEANMKEAQELVELALVRQARKTMNGISTHSDPDMAAAENRAVFDELVRQYNAQPNLNVRTSTSMENQAYSTPAPLAMIASQLAGITKDTWVYEPTAGNGMLLIGAAIENSRVNEINDKRAANLRSLGYEVEQQDARYSNPPPSNTQERVITNPPFGRLKNAEGNLHTVKSDGYAIKAIDHLIAVNALDSMTDDGRATLIIGANKEPGGQTEYDKTFFNYLYSHYNVIEHFEVNGDLYKRQGAGWPVRVITINGRVASRQVSPRSGTIDRLDSWEEIYDRYNESVAAIGQQPDTGGTTSVEPGNQQEGPNQGQPGPAVQGDVQTTQSDGSGRGPGANAGNSPGSTVGSGDSQQQLGQGGIDSAGGQQPTGVDGQSGSDSTGDTNNAGPGKGPQGAGSTQNAGTTANKPDVESGSDFQVNYPVRSGGFNDKVLVPNNMAEALNKAMTNIEEALGMTVDQYVVEKLGYASIEEMYGDAKVGLMGLQVDTIAAAIYNFEEKGKGIIIADQTGVGKGRQAAGILRYAKRQGKTPIFATVDSNLYTDMFDDLNEIGEKENTPFLIDRKVGIKSKYGTVARLKEGERASKIQEILETGRLPEGNDMLFMTYHQIKTANQQREVIRALKDNAIVVLDESHNVSGVRETVKKVDGVNQTVVSAAGFMYEMIEDQPVVYLSATFAKRAENMAIYYRTDLMDAVDTPQELIDAVERGGVPVQQVMAAMLTESGQLFRRERSFEGISINKVIDYDHGEQHRDQADQVTDGLRAIIDADKTFDGVFFPIYAEEQEKQGGSASIAGNKAASSVDHHNFTSIVHSKVRQLLFSMKADRAAELAIEAWNRVDPKTGKPARQKPVLAMESTFGAFLKDYVKTHDLKDGDVVDADYRDILLSALEGSRRISVKDDKGNDLDPIQIELEQLDPTTKLAYESAEQLIRDLDIGDLPLSPIDHMRWKLEEAGISVEEITGRGLRIDYSSGEAILRNIPNQKPLKRGKINGFNSGSVDALILNVSGSTGLSIHSSANFEDQRPRKMIVVQTMQDINILMQMLGRVNRTGQVVVPEYVLMGVDLPAEKRPMAITARKMTSLNANTSANDESDTSIDAPDMLNKYGDRVINTYLQENMDIARMTGVEVAFGDAAPEIGLAMKFTGRLALMPVALQEEVYADVEESYEAEIDYLTRTGQNELIAQTVDLDARIKDSRIVYEGKAPETIFGGNTTLHKVDGKYQGKPPSVEDVESALEKGAKLPSIKDIVATKEADTSYLEKLGKKMIEAKAAFAAHEAVYDPEDEASGKKRERLELAYGNAVRGQLEAAEAQVDGKKLIAQFEIGNRFLLDLGDEVVTGVVTAVKDSHKDGKGNPWAKSKTKVHFMVNSGIRQIELPLSKLTVDAGILTERLRGKGKEGLGSVFTVHETGRREERYVATGNLISGVAKLEGGRIVNFTDAESKVHQGILMPKKFNRGRKKGEFETAGGQNNFPIRDPEVVKKLLHDSDDSLIGAGGVFDGTQSVRITRTRNGGWMMQVPKSNRANISKLIKFDAELRKSIGDFAGSGKFQNARFDESLLDQVVDRVMEITPLYVLPSMADSAVAAGASPPSEAVQAFDPVTKDDAAKPTDWSIDDDTPSYSIIKSDGKPGISVAEVNNAIGPALKRLKLDGSLDVVVLPNRMAGPVIFFEEKGSSGAYYQGKVYLFADQISSKRKARTVLAHELIGHKGVMEMSSPQEWAEITKTIDDLVITGNKSATSIGEEVVRRYGRDIDPNVFHKEFMAIAAERRQKRGPIAALVAKVKEIIRRYLKTFGLNRFSESEIDVILSQSVRYLRAVGEGDITSDTIYYSRIAAAAKLTPSEVAEWRDLHKVSQRKGRVPRVKMAADALQAGDMSIEKYNKIVKHYMPVMPIQVVPEITSTQDISAAITPEKAKSILNVDVTIEPGTRVASRLDIPAYDFYDTWVTTIHDGAKRGGKSVAYGGHAVMSNIEFVTSPKAALGIATQETAKAPFARMHGDWVDMSPQEAQEMAKTAMSSPEWVQVGMNPFRHSYFYDKATGAPVVGAESAVQIGPLVMAKNVVYASPTDERFRVGDSDVFFSDDKAPEFYSALKVAAYGLSQEKGTPQQMINSMKKLGGVKQEELEWTGLEEYLWLEHMKAAGGTVTKDQIIEYLANNGVQVETVTLGGDGPLVDTTVNQVYEVSFDEEEGGHVIHDPNGEIMYGFGGELLVFDNEDEAWQSLSDEQKASGFDGQTKHAGEATNVPGGTNYREVLLTLPVHKGHPLDAQIQAGLAELGWDTELDAASPVSLTRAGRQDLAKKLIERNKATKSELDRKYTGGHYGETPNVLAHIRMDDRVDADGKKVLFIQEIQSDWHQSGKKAGYTGSMSEDELENQRALAEEKEADLRRPALSAIKKYDNFDRGPDHPGSVRALWDIWDDPDWVVTLGAMDESLNAPIQAWRDAQIEQNRIEQKLASLRGDSVPDAPFKGNAWVELSVKKIMRIAAEGGYDRVAWTTGEQQAERYDLSKHVSEITYERDSDGGDNFDILVIDHGGAEIFKEEDITLSRIEALIGKDLAEKIDKGEGDSVNGPLRDWKKLSGLDIKVGGEGLRTFYDKNLRNVFNKVGRRLDKKARVSVVQLADSFTKIVNGTVMFPAGAEEKGWVDSFLVDLSMSGFEGFDYGRSSISDDDFGVMVDFIGWSSLDAATLEGLAESNGGVVTITGEIERGRGYRKSEGFSAQGIDLTEKMVSSALEGQPLFSKGRTDAEKLRDFDTKAQRDSDKKALAAQRDSDKKALAALRDSDKKALAALRDSENKALAAYGRDISRQEAPGLSRRGFMKRALQAAVASSYRLEMAVGGATTALVVVGGSNKIKSKYSGLEVGRAVPTMTMEEADTRLPSEVADLLIANDIKGALELLATDGLEVFRPLAERLSKDMPEQSDLEINVKIYGTRSNGYWRSSVDGSVSTVPGRGPLKMALYQGEKNSGLDYGTFFHESLHLGVMSRWSSIEGSTPGRYKLLGKTVTQSQPALKQFRELHDEFRSAARGKLTKMLLEGDSDISQSRLVLSIQQSMESADEFFVRTLTDPEFQVFLSSMPYEGKTLMERFKDWIKTHLFGLDEGTIPSWLDAALIGAEDVLIAMDAEAVDLSFTRDSLDYRIKASQKSRGEEQQEIAYFSRNSRASSDNLGDVEGAREVVEKGGFGINGPVANAEGWWKRVRPSIGVKIHQGLVDQYRSFTDILDNPRAWMMARLTKGAVGALHGLVEFGGIEMHENAIRLKRNEDGSAAIASLKEILEPLGKELDRWTYWVAGNRSARLLEEDREKLFSAEDVEILQSLNQNTKEFPDRAALYDSVLSEFEKLGDSVARVAVEGGIISEEEADLWLEQGFYLPFYRVMEDEDKPAGAFFAGGQELVRQRAYHHLKGGRQKLDDLLTNQLMNWHHLISASLANQAASSAIDSAVEMRLARPVSQRHASGQAIFILEGGERKWYELDSSPEGKLVLESLTSLNRKGQDGYMMDAAAATKRMLTVGVTASPEFKLTNLIRDTIQAIAVTDMSVNIVKNLFQGFKATRKGSEALADMTISGALFSLTGSGYTHGEEAQAIRHLTKKAGFQRSSILTSPNIVKSAWYEWESIGARAENVNRAANFVQSRKIDPKTGLPKKDLLTAAHEARDHLDFTSQGSWSAIRALTKVVPFLNARMQGLDKLARSVRDPAQKAQFLTVVTTYSMLSVLLYLRIKDDEDYQEQDQWVRDTYHLFKVPGSDTLYAIPRPFEVGAIASAAERLVEQMVDDDVHGSLFAERVGHTLSETFSFNPTPQMFKPALEVAMDKNWFTGAPIEGMSLKNLSPEKRARAWTSSTTIATSELMNKVSWGKVVLSPVQMQHLVRGYFGWLGSTALAGTDFLIDSVKDSPDKPMMRSSEWPVVKRFVRANPARSTKYTSLFYERWNAIGQAYADIGDARKSKDLEEYRRLILENKNKIQLRRLYNQQGKRLSGIRALTAQIYANESLDPRQKRMELDRLQRRKNAITKLIDERTRSKFN